MRAVLMAAGMGKRLAPASGGIAKALAHVQGKTLLQHQIETLRLAGFDDNKLVIVGGFDHSGVADIVAQLAPNATLLENTNYRQQNLLTLLTARDVLKDGFLLVNVDHLMPTAIHKRMLSHTGPLVACVESGRELADDEMKVALDSNGNLMAISKQLTQFDVGYIGMTRCDADAVPMYLAAADIVLTKVGAQRAVVEMVLGQLAATGVAANVCDCAGFKWAEVDTPSDLDAANALLNSLPDFFDQT